MLRIEVQGLSLEKKNLGKIYLNVEGSKSGTLTSDLVSAERPEWDPYFRVDCNQSDKVVFKVIAVKKSQ
jgi:hypothetical protein